MNANTVSMSMYSDDGIENALRKITQRLSKILVCLFLVMSLACLDINCKACCSEAQAEADAHAAAAALVTATFAWAAAAVLWWNPIAEGIAIGVAVAADAAAAGFAAVYAWDEQNLCCQ